MGQLLPPISADRLAPVKSGMLKWTIAEFRIARAICTGYSQQECAELFGISPRTVEVHLRRLRGKCGGCKRGELAYFAAALEDDFEVARHLRNLDRLFRKRSEAAVAG